MGITRFLFTKDTFVSNKVLPNQNTRSVQANFGSSPTLQAYKITSSFPNADAEISRILVNFNYRHLSGMVFNEQTIPSSSAKYYLKCFDYVVGDGTPSSYDLSVYPVASAWDEGVGEDDLNGTDLGYANWLSGSSTQPWISGGADYITSGGVSQHFDAGHEDLEVEVTTIVQSWLSGNIEPNGFLIKLSNACEQNQVDYWRKVFYSRETHVVEKVPYLEARYNDVITDNRGNFAYNNPNALYLYNLVRGYLRNAVQPVTLRLQDNLIGASCSFQQTYSASQLSLGVYTSPIGIYTNNPYAYSSSWIDVWQDGNGMCLMSGTFQPLIVTGSQSDPYEDFIVNAVDLKRVYRSDETARITVNVRKNYHCDHLAVHTASIDTNREYMENMYWSVVNDSSGEVIVPFGTGSALPYTKMSYNGSGNYFQMCMSSFVPGFTYRLVFLIIYNKYEKNVIDDKFIFKVV